MSYATGDTIQATDYNTSLLAASGPTNYGINYIMGTGASGYGLGQTTLSTVGVSDAITAAQWNSLFSAMSNIANHTNDTLTSTTLKAVGDTIAVKTALQSDLNTLAASVNNGCPNATALTTNSAVATVTSGSARWQGSHTVEISVTFASANNMRYFFNAGGKLIVRAARTALANAGGGANSSSINTKESQIDTLISAVGNLSIKSQTSSRSGSGQTATTDGLSNGFYDLTTGYTTILRLTNASTYSGQYIQVDAKLDAAPGSSTVMTIKYAIVDASPEASGAVDQTYTSGNTASVNAYVDYIGTTAVYLDTVVPNTTEGLTSVYSYSSTATVSNTTV
jgi:hypothetical protein